MLGLSPLGVIHTAASLVALACGFWSFARYKQILFHSGVGKTYLVTTAITAASALGIFRHSDSFGPPHALGVLALIALAVGSVAAVTEIFGRWSRYMQALCFSSTMLFHVIPGSTEALIRFPPSHPVLTISDEQVFAQMYGVMFVVFLICLALQLRWLAGNPAPG